MKRIINILLTILFSFVYYYFAMPAINIHSVSFYLFIILIIICFTVLNNLLSVIEFLKKGKTKPVKEYTMLIIPLIIVLVIIWNIIESPLFMASKYAKRIEIDTGKNFSTDISEVDFSKLPLLDKKSSQALGDRVMGQMRDLVSQYNVSDIYTQINYNERIIRVTPLEYASPIKWLTNRKEGVKGYITVDSTTGKANLIRLDKGMKYVQTGLFNDNAYRKIRFSHPTRNLGHMSFEIDNDGNPYWVVPTIKYSGVGLRAEVTGIIILNAITGTTSEYKVGNIPNWIDIALSADLIIDQVDDWGKYQNGYFNSVFSQKNMVKTTDGYNYLAMNDDIYLYTGLTSAVTDESTLGFILTNMRTGETSFYSVPGAEEYSAMASAEGAVQQMKYTSTFPLLINLKGNPTYLLSLKDDAGLVKMYAFIDVNDYQKVIVTDVSKGINEAAKNYLKNAKITSNSQNKSETITIKKIETAVINGNTYYFITDENNKKYKASIELSDELPFKKGGDKLKISYASEEDITIINKIN